MAPDSSLPPILLAFAPQRKVPRGLRTPFRRVPSTYLVLFLRSLCSSTNHSPRARALFPLEENGRFAAPSLSRSLHITGGINSNNAALNFKKAGEKERERFLLPLVLPKEKKKERKEKKARNGIEKWIIERTVDTFEYSSPSRGERERRYQKRRRRRRCGSRREEWVSLFDRNLAAKGEDEEEDTKISRKKWRGEKKTGGGERRARERAGERERESGRRRREGVKGRERRSISGCDYDFSW